MKEVIKNTFIMLIITIVAGGILGFVYDSTKDVIAKQEEEKKILAYKTVFSDAEDFNELSFEVDDSLKSSFVEAGFAAEDIDGLVVAKSATGENLGYILLITTHEGYGGDISFTMGVRNDGTLNGISLLSISETAGLGMEAGKVLVPQFKDRKATQFTYTKTGALQPDEIDAISGATITTNAITNGVNLGLYYFNEFLGGANHE